MKSKRGFTSISKVCQRGFTLIELLVVIFIIGILAGVILPNFVSSRERARDARRKGDLSQIKNALGIYYNDNQSYPATGDVPFGAPFNDGATIYMQQVPNDPLAPDQSYEYCAPADGDSFRLCASLENEGDSEAGESLLRCPVTMCALACTDNCYYICGN